jgi:hypothetical protein
MTLARRPWVPAPSEDLVQSIAQSIVGQDAATLLARIDALAEQNRQIHERDCFNLNPAANVMNPRAEALLSSRLGSRPSLGYPGDKYEMGLEAIEEIEVIAAELAAEVFDARYAEIRVASGAMANLYAFMATCRPGDTIIAPPGQCRRPCHPPRRGLCGALRAAHPACAGSAGWLHRRHRSAGLPGSHRTPPADHHRRQPEPRRTPGGRASRHRRRGRRDAALRRGASMRDHRGRRGKTRSPRARI